MSEQCRDNLRVPIFGSDHQRGAAIELLAVDIGAEFEQQVDTIQVPILDCQYQGCPAKEIPAIVAATELSQQQNTALAASIRAVRPSQVMA